MPRYTLIYQLTVVREIEAEDDEAAEADAWDFVPYPAVEGDVVSADCDHCNIEDENGEPVIAGDDEDEEEGEPAHV